MTNPNEIFNIYVEKLVAETSELLKTKVFLTAQVSYLEKVNADINKQLAEMSAKVLQLQETLDKVKVKKKGESDKTDSDF